MKKWLENLSKTTVGKAVLARIKRIEKVLDDLGHKQVGLLAAGIAFFAILAFFPLIVALVAISSIFLQPDSISQATITLTHVLPHDLANLISTQLHNAEGHHADSIIAATIAIVVSLVSVAGATGSLMGALNVMYGYRETRSFAHQKAVSLVLTLGIVVTMLVIIALLFVSGNLLAHAGVSGTLLHVIDYGRWAVLIFVMMVGLGVLYHSAPNRPPHEKWQWMTRGAVIATVIWVFVSILFFWYLGSLANLTRAYSLFAGIIGMMLWFELTAYVVLLGAEINLRHTRRTK